MSETTIREMEPFRHMVRQLIAMGSPVRIDNSSAEHAKVILEEMFRAAQKTAYVFCGCISLPVWGSVAMAENIEDAIATRGVSVRFIVQNPQAIPVDSPTVAALRRHKGTIVTSPIFKDFASHFAVFDSKMYRFEKSDAAKTAVACANGRESAGQLHQLAEQMIDVATEA